MVIRAIDMLCRDEAATFIDSDERMRNAAERAHEDPADQEDLRTVEQALKNKYLSRPIGTPSLEQEDLARISQQEDEPLIQYYARFQNALRQARSIPSLSDDEDDDAESELDDDPDTPSYNGEGSGADVDIGNDGGMDDEDDARDKTPFDMDIDSGVEDMDMEMDDPVDDINEGLDQMDMRDDSVSTNTAVEESEIDNDDDDDNNDDDDDNNDDGNDGNDGDGDGNDDDSDGNGNDGDENGDLDNGNEDHSRREWSSLFVQQNDDVESSLFVRSNRASTHFKTDSDEEIKEESYGSVIDSVGGYRSPYARTRVQEEIRRED